MRELAQVDCLTQLIVPDLYLALGCMPSAVSRLGQPSVAPMLIKELRLM